MTVRDQGTATSSAAFSLLEPLVVSDVSPRSGAPNSEVVLRGSGFIPSLRGQQVTLASRRCRVLSASTNELRVLVPRNAITGVFEVEIRGRATARAAVPFQIITPPTVTRFEPASAAPGADVTVFGDNLGMSIGQVRVALAGRPCAIRSVGLGQIIVQIPQGAGSGRFQVSVEGMGSAESPTDFMVLAPLTISAIQPPAAVPGSTVTIVGTGFSPVARNNIVRLNGRTQRVMSANGTQLQVLLGRTAASGVFEVMVRERGETVRSPAFTLEAAIVAADFSPRSGPVGSEVILRGRGFDAPGGVRVTIGGRTCQVVAATANELRFIIPPGSVTGTIRISARRVGDAETRDAFTVAAVQAVSVASIEIVALPGRAPGRIRLRGAGFGGNARAVTVNVMGNTPSVVLCTPDVIEFLVPSTVSGNLGRVRVTVAGVGEATSPMDLVLGPPPPTTPPPRPPYRQPPPPARRR